jgi:hypothetical protein
MFIGGIARLDSIISEEQRPVSPGQDKSFTAISMSFFGSKGFNT